jgi:hypothetical protein
MGPGGGQLAQSLGRPASFDPVQTKTSWTCVYTRRERLWQWRKSVEAELISRLATWLGRPAATLRVTASTKLVELPHGPINTPLPVKVDTHTPHFRDSTCKAPFLSVVARCSLVGKVVRL